MRRGTPRRSEQNQSLDEEIGKIPEQLLRRKGLKNELAGWSALIMDYESPHF
jgi:hypothetical protein